MDARSLRKIRVGGSMSPEEIDALRQRINAAIAADPSVTGKLQDLVTEHQINLGIGTPDINPAYEADVAAQLAAGQGASPVANINPPAKPPVVPPGTAAAAAGGAARGLTALGVAGGTALGMGIATAGIELADWAWENAKSPLGSFQQYQPGGMGAGGGGTGVNIAAALNKLAGLKSRL